MVAWGCVPNVRTVLFCVKHFRIKHFATTFTIFYHHLGAMRHFAWDPGKMAASLALELARCRLPHVTMNNSNFNACLVCQYLQLMATITICTYRQYLPQQP